MRCFCFLLLCVPLCFGVTRSPSYFTFSDNTTCASFNFNSSSLPDVVFKVPKFRMCWSIVNTTVVGIGNTTIIDMILQVRTGGLVAWGIGDQLGGGMLGGADIIQGYFSNGVITAIDLWSTSTGRAPPLDPVQSVLPGHTGYRTGGTTALRFQRLLNTNDSKDRPITPGVLELLVGYGPDDKFRDKHTDAALTYVDLFTGQGPPIGANTVSQVRVDPTQYQFVASILPPYCKLFWKLTNVNTSISAAMECSNSGYIAFGFSNQNAGGMTNADMIVGRVVGTTMQVQDYWSSSQATPQLDTTQSLTATSGSRVGGNVTTMFFTRLLSTGDAKDYIVKPGLTECIVAFHQSSDLFIYHDRFRSTVFIDFFSGVAPAPPTPAAIDATWNPTAYPNRFDVIPGEFELYWAVDSTQTQVSFAIRVLGKWAAFGPASSSAGLMTSSDPMMAYFDATGAPVIEDQFSVSISTPVGDTNKGGKADFTAMAGSINATGLTVKWTRAFNTGDAITDNQMSKTAATTFVLAWGTSSSPSYHGASRAAVSINLMTGSATVTASSSDPLKIAHGSLMAIAFGLSMSVGMIIALVVPKDKAWWFPAHWILQAFATVLVFISFFIILAWYQQSGSVHFRTNSLTMGSHAIIGIIVIILVVWQMILGIVADRVWQAKHKKTGEFPSTTIFPDKTHWWLGRFILVIACINIFLGIAEMGYNWPFYVGWAIFCMALVALFAIGFIYFFKVAAHKGHTSASVSLNQNPHNAND